MEDFVDLNLGFYSAVTEKSAKVQELFRKFDSALCRAAIESKDKDALKNKVNETAKIATANDGGINPGDHARGLAKRLLEVSTDTMAIQENLLFVLDSIMRHAERKGKEVLAKFERAFEPHVLQLIKKTLNKPQMRPDTKDFMAKYLETKLMPVWQRKCWFPKVIYHIGKVLKHSQLRAKKKMEEEEVFVGPPDMEPVSPTEVPDTGEDHTSDYPEPDRPGAPFEVAYDPLSGKVYGEFTEEPEEYDEEPEDVEVPAYESPGSVQSQRTLSPWSPQLSGPTSPQLAPGQTPSSVGSGPTSPSLVKPPPVEEIPPSITATSIPMVPRTQVTRPPESYVRTQVGTQDFEDFEALSPTEEGEEVTEEGGTEDGMDQVPMEMEPPGGFPEYSMIPSAPDVTQLPPSQPSKTVSTEAATSQTTRTREAPEAPPASSVSTLPPATIPASSEKLPYEPTEEAFDDDDLTALDRELLDDVRTRDVAVQEAREPGTEPATSETIIRTSPAPSDDQEGLMFEPTEPGTEDMDLVVGEPEQVASPTELPVPGEEDVPTPTSPADRELFEDVQGVTVPTAVPTVQSASSVQVGSTVGGTKSAATVASGTAPTLLPPKPGRPGAAGTMSPTEEDIVLAVPSEQPEPTSPGDDDADLVFGISAPAFDLLPPRPPDRVQVVTPSSPTEMPVPTEEPEPTSPADQDADLFSNLSALTRLVVPAPSSPTEVAVPTERGRDVFTEVGDRSPTELPQIGVPLRAGANEEQHLPTIGSSESEMPEVAVPPPAPRRRDPRSRVPTDGPTEMPVPTERPSPTSPVGAVTEDRRLSTEVVSTAPPTVTTRTRADEREVAVPAPPLRRRDRRTPRTEVPTDEVLVPQVGRGAATEGKGATSSPTELPVPTEAVAAPTDQVGTEPAEEQHSPTSVGDVEIEMPPSTQQPTEVATVPVDAIEMLPPPPRRALPKAAPRDAVTEEVPPLQPMRRDRRTPSAGSAGVVLPAPSSPTEMPVPTEQPSPTSPGERDSDMELEPTRTQERAVSTVGTSRSAAPTEFAPQLQVPPPRRREDASSRTVPSAEVEEIAPLPRGARQGRTEPPVAEPSSPTEMPVPTEVPSDDDMEIVPGAGSLTQEDPATLRPPPPLRPRRDATTPRDVESEVIAPPRPPALRSRRETTTPREPMTEREEIAPLARPPRTGRTPRTPGAAPPSPTEMPVPTERPSPTEEGDEEQLEDTTHEMTIPGSVSVSIPPTTVAAEAPPVELQVPAARPPRRDLTTPRDALTEEIAPPARPARERTQRTPGAAPSSPSEMPVPTERPSPTEEGVGDDVELRVPPARPARDRRTPRDALTEEIAPPLRSARDRRTPRADDVDAVSVPPSPTEMPVPTELPSPTSPGDVVVDVGTIDAPEDTPALTLVPPTTVAATEDAELPVPVSRPPVGRETTTPRDALTEEIAPPVRAVRDGRTPADAQTEEVPPMRPLRTGRERTPMGGRPAPSSPSEMPVPTELPSPTSPGGMDEDQGAIMQEGSELTVPRSLEPPTAQATQDSLELQVPPLRPPPRDARTPLADAGTEEIPPLQPVVRLRRDRTPGTAAPSSPTEMPVPTELPSPTSPGGMDVGSEPERQELTVPGSLPPPSTLASDMEEVMVPLRPPRASGHVDTDVVSEDLGLVPPVPVRTGRDARTPRQDAGTEEIVPPARDRTQRVRTPADVETEIPIPTEMPVPTEQPSPTSVAGAEDEAPDADELGVPLTLPSRAQALPAEAEELDVPVTKPPRRPERTELRPLEVVDDEEELIRPPTKRRRQDERVREVSSPTEMPVPTEQPSPTSPVAAAGQEEDEDQPMQIPAAFNLRDEKTGVVTAPPSSPTELPQMYEPTSPAEEGAEEPEEPGQVQSVPTVLSEAPTLQQPSVPPSTATMPPDEVPFTAPPPVSTVEASREEPEDDEIMVPTEVPPPTKTQPSESVPPTVTTTIAPPEDQEMPVPVPVPQQEAAPMREDETPAPAPADEGTQVLILRFPNAPHPAPADFKRKLVTSLRGIGATRLSELSLKLRPGLLAELRGPTEALRALRALGLQKLEVLQYRISAVQGPGPESSLRQLRAAAKAFVEPSPTATREEQTPMEYPSPGPSPAARTPGSVTSLPAAATPPASALGLQPAKLRGSGSAVQPARRTPPKPGGFKTPLTPIERAPGQPGTPDYSPTEDLAEPGTPQDATVARALRAAAGREPSAEPGSYSYLEESADLKDGLPPTPTYVGSSPTYVDDAEPPTPTLDADSAGYGDDVESVASWFQSVTPRPMRPGGTPDSAGPLTPTSAVRGGLTPQVQPLTPLSTTEIGGPGTPAMMRLPGMESPTPTYDADEATVYGDDASSLASWIENATPKQTAGNTTPLSGPGTPGSRTPGASISGAPTTPLGFSALGTPPPGQPVTPASGGPGTPGVTSAQPATPQTLQQDSTIVGEPGTPHSSVQSVQVPGTPLGSAASAASTPLAIPAGSTPQAATGGSTAAGTPPQAGTATGTPPGTAATGTPQSLQPATPLGQPGTPLQMASSSFAPVSAASLRPQMPPPAPAMPFVSQAAVGMTPAMQTEYDPFAPPMAPPVGVPTAPGGAPSFFSAPPPPPPGGPPAAQSTASSSAAEAPPPPPPPMAAGSSSEAPPAAGAPGMPALASEVFPQLAGKRKQRGGGASSDEELPPWKRRAARRKKQ